jgi:transposase
MPPAYVKPYVKRQKNDAADAEAICEAVTRPNMRFVETKTPEQQSCLMLHRTRSPDLSVDESCTLLSRMAPSRFLPCSELSRLTIEHFLDRQRCRESSHWQRLAAPYLATPRRPPSPP